MIKKHPTFDINICGCGQWTTNDDMCLHCRDRKGKQLVGTYITTDADGLNVVAGMIYPDANGKTSFMLDEGSYFVHTGIACSGKL